MEQVYAVVPDFGLRIYQRFSDGELPHGGGAAQG